MLQIFTGEHTFNSAHIKDLDISKYDAETQHILKIINDWQQGADVFNIKTSGSTGKPKSKSLEKDKIIFSAKRTADFFGLDRNDTLWCCLSPESIAGFMMIMRALVLEADLLITNPSSNPMTDLPLHAKFDFVSFVPMQLENILEYSFESLNRLNRTKAILVGGAAISKGLEEKIQLIQAPVFHSFSMTETYTHLAVRRINGPYRQESFYPLEGVKVMVDERGCLNVSGYETGFTFLATNDIAEMFEDGSFVIKGRIDNVINSGGVKIQAEEVEKAALQAIDEIFHKSYEVIAIPVNDDNLGQKVCLIVETEHNWPEKELSNFLNSMKNKINRYWVPKEVRFMEKFPETTSGKVDRQKITRLFN